MKKKESSFDKKASLKYENLSTQEISESFKQWLAVIGDNFRSLRIHAKEDIGTVARAVKVKNGTLYRLEIGLHDWDTELIGRLCTYFKVRPEDVSLEGKFKLPRSFKAKKPSTHELN